MCIFILVLQLVFCTYASCDSGCFVEKKVEKNSITFDLSKINHSQTEQLDQLLPPSFYLHKLEIVSDILLDDVELRSLLALPEGLLTTREALSSALTRLTKKRKFKEVALEYAMLAEGAQITMTLASEWTLAHLQMRGTLIGKERYRHYYVLEPNDIFDLKKHQSGIEKIEHALASEGYFNACLTDTFSYDQATKTVKVSLHIDHKKQFIIRDVELQLKLQDGLCIDDQGPLQARLTKMMRNLFRLNGYSKELLDRSAKKLQEYLVKVGYFNSTIELEESIDRATNSVRLVLTVLIKHKNIFEFRGNAFFTQDQLLAQIQLFGKSVTLIPPSLICEEFIALYKKEGFWNAEISWEDSGERTFFLIKEGRRIGISDVVIRGAVEIPEKELIQRYFKKILSARYFNGDLFKQVLDELGQGYLEQGFWDFAVTHYEYIPLAENRYQLVITINEGKRRWLSGVKIEQDVGLACDATSIKRYQDLACPVPFDIRIITEQKQQLMRALQATGRLYARPHPELVEAADQPQQGTQLLWKFAGSTAVVQFGDTIIIGNSALPEHIIARELLYKKGDIWDQQKIEKSVVRLKKLGIFDTITLAPEDVGTTEFSKTLLLKYVEDFPYEVRARLGIQGVNRNIVQFNAEGISYKAGGSFLVKNPFNRGDCIRFDLDFSRYMYDVVASYKFPWLFNQPIRTEIKAYSSHYDQPFVIGSPKVLYKALQDGFLFGFSKEYKPFDLEVTVGCEWLEIKPGDGCGSKKESLAQAIFLDPRLINKKYPYLFMQPTLFSSSLDNKIQPTKGALSLASCKAMIAPTFSRAAFFKILLEQSFFVPWGSIVFAFRGRCGTIVNANFKDINPIERFYLGGAYSVRSYEPDLAPPLNPFRDNQGCLHLVPTGGRSMVNINTELRFPVYGNLSGVLFNDIGALSDKCIRAAVKEHKIVGALGFGLRFNTVVGPIRFDIGWKLHRQPVLAGVKAERPYAWFLALGNAF